MSTGCLSCRWLVNKRPAAIGRGIEGQVVKGSVMRTWLLEACMGCVDGLTLLMVFGALHMPHCNRYGCVARVGSSGPASHGSCCVTWLLWVLL